MRLTMSEIGVFPNLRHCYPHNSGTKIDIKNHYINFLDIGPKNIAEELLVFSGKYLFIFWSAFIYIYIYQNWKIWCFTPPSGLEQLAYTQKKIVRAIFRKPNFNKDNHSYASNTSLYKILKLYDLYYFNLACLAHDYFHCKKSLNHLIG